MEIQVYLHVKGRETEKTQERQPFHNKGKKHQTTSRLYFLTLPIREIQEMLLFPPPFFFNIENNFVLQSETPPICCIQLYVCNGVDQTEPRGMRKAQEAWAGGMHIIHYVALLCFYTHQRSSHSRLWFAAVSGNHPSLPSQFTPCSSSLQNIHVCSNQDLFWGLLRPQTSFHLWHWKRIYNTHISPNLLGWYSNTAFQ